MPPTCRLHYGGILIAIGRWAEAEEELLAAIRTFDRGYRAMRVFPLVRLAELRVLQGRLEEAERLLEGDEFHPAARVRGQSRWLEATSCWPRSSRGWASTARPLRSGVSALLELLVDVQLARNDSKPRGDARRARRAGGDAGHDRGARPLSSRRAAWRSRGDERAAAHLQAALKRFSALDLPLAAARAQLELALRRSRARTRRSSRRVSRSELRTARRARDADAAGELLRGLGAAGRAWPSAGALTKRETRSSPSWPKGARTPRSASGSTSALEPPSTTSRASCPSSACAAAPRQPPMRFATRP